MKKNWKDPLQGEFEVMAECYAANYLPLDLKKDQYKNDRNYEFYRLQNELLKNYTKTGKLDGATLWKMQPYILGTMTSLAKKFVVKGKCKCPNFKDKCEEATLRVLELYKAFPYYRAKKLENVCFSKMREVFYDKNLQLQERALSFDVILEKKKNKEGQGDLESDYSLIAYDLEQEERK